MKREHSFIIVIAAVLLFFLIYSSHPVGYGMHAVKGGRGGFLVPRLFGPLFWVFLIVFLFYLFQESNGERGEREEAIGILKKRYAGGEISRDEYLEVFKDIMEK